jgi:hypothetical protein
LGAIISGSIQVSRWLLLFVFLPALVIPAAAQRQPRRSPHGALNTPCENCHTNTSWAPIRAIPEFNHDTTRYPLRGMHEKVACTSCHIKPVFTDVGKNCADCHADIHRAQFGANCAQCHSVLGWQVSMQSVRQHFNRFPLLGAHAVVECEECHKNSAVGNYLGLSTACSSCHLSDWQQTTNPAHASAGTTFAASNCTSCHNFDSWLNANFNHSSTGFLLTNGHANVACSLCHINNNYNLTIAPTDCGNSQCHLTTWQQTTGPVHSSAGPAFAATNCSTCHTTVGWTTAPFDHSTTGFALTGMHMSPVPTPCIACHVANNYTLTSTACYGCHTADWQGTTTLGGSVPNHITAGFPQDCSVCHSTANWTAAAFNHSSTTFPLTGAHTTVVCAQCHVNGNYSGTLPTDCYSCHTADWQSTTTLGGPVPNHISSGYPTTCASCHTTASWLGAAFNHTTTGFPLTGAHVTVACNLCHISSATPPADCYSCHTSDWNSTVTLGGMVPNHNAASQVAGTQFVTSSCSSCHTTTNWLGATFNHSLWSTTHGNAGGICGTCHTNSSDYSAFVCSNATCHPQSQINQTHQGVSSYVYSSGATCYACHQNAGGGG